MTATKRNAAPPAVTERPEPMQYRALPKGIEHVGAPSRGIVLFNNSKATMWECNDGYSVIKWVESHYAPGSPYYDAAQRNGGVKHAVVWVYSLGDVTHESTD